MAYLINAGIIPMTFVNEADYDTIEQMDELQISNLKEAIAKDNELTVKNVTKGTEFKVSIELSQRQREMLIAGGLLNYTKKMSE